MPSMKGVLSARDILAFSGSVSLYAHGDSVAVYEDGKISGHLSFDELWMFSMGAPWLGAVLGIRRRDRELFSSSVDFSRRPISTFTDRHAGTYSMSAKLNEKQFLVRGTVEDPTWRTTGEERTILGFDVYQAVTIVDSTHIEAWYAPEIAYQGGPDQYGGLPGLILALSVDKGRESFTAVAIDLETDPEIIQPDEGLVVFEDEYEQMLADTRREIEENSRRGRRAARRRRQ